MSAEIVPFATAPLDQRVRYSEQLANAGDLIPRGLRDNRGNPVPGKILLVAETGSMLGMHPIAALQGVNIIDGKPTISPALMSAVVRRAGHKLRVTTSGSVREGTFEATATLIRSDDPDHPFIASWNAERAQRAGLLGKTNWKNYFEAMCKARAISEVCREGAEDALMGVGYVPEELGAEVDEDGNVVESPEPQGAHQGFYLQPKKPSRDWAAEAEKITDPKQLTNLANEAQQLGELALPIGLAGDNDDGSPFTVFQVLKARKDALDASAKPEPMVAEPPAPKPRQWVQEAQGKADAESVRELYREAEAAEVDASVLQQIEAIEASFSAPSDDELAKGPGWAPSEPADAEWNVAQVPTEQRAEAASGGEEEPF